MENIHELQHSWLRQFISDVVYSIENAKALEEANDVLRGTRNLPFGCFSSRIIRHPLGSKPH
jgi:hypothetical protein